MQDCIGLLLVLYMSGLDMMVSEGYLSGTFWYLSLVTYFRVQLDVRTLNCAVDSSILKYLKYPLQWFLKTFFHWYLCKHRYKVVSSFKNVMKSTHKKMYTYFFQWSRFETCAQIFHRPLVRFNRRSLHISWPSSGKNALGCIEIFGRGTNYRQVINKMGLRLI